MSCRLFVTCEIHNNWRKWSLLEFEVPFFYYPSLNAESVPLSAVQLEHNTQIIAVGAMATSTMIVRQLRSEVYKNFTIWTHRHCARTRT